MIHNHLDSLINLKYQTISPSPLRMSVRSREDVQVEPEKKKT